MDPRQTGLAPSFVSTRFAFWRWQSCQLLRTGLFCALATGRASTAPSQHNERVRRSADSYLEELEAEAAGGRGASPWKFRIVICSTFNGEATEAATKRRPGLRQSP